MSIEKKLTAIVKYLHQEGSKTVKELVKHFGYSAETMQKHVNELAKVDKVYFYKDSQSFRYVVLIPDNCKAELYERVNVAEWIEQQKKKGA